MPSSRLCRQLQTCGVSRCTYTHAQINLEKRKKIRFLMLKGHENLLAYPGHVEPGPSSKGHTSALCLQPPYHRGAQQGMAGPGTGSVPCSRPPSALQVTAPAAGAGRVQLRLHSTAPQVHSTANTIRTWCPRRLRTWSASCTPRFQSLGD